MVSLYKYLTTALYWIIFLSSSRKQQSELCQRQFNQTKDFILPKAEINIWTVASWHLHSDASTVEFSLQTRDWEYHAILSWCLQFPLIVFTWRNAPRGGQKTISLCPLAQEASDAFSSFCQNAGWLPVLCFYRIPSEKENTERRRLWICAERCTCKLVFRLIYFVADSFGDVQGTYTTVLLIQYLVLVNNYWPLLLQWRTLCPSPRKWWQKYI